MINAALKGTHLWGMEDRSNWESAQLDVKYDTNMHFIFSLYISADLQGFHNKLNTKQQACRTARQSPYTLE